MISREKFSWEMDFLLSRIIEILNLWSPADHASIILFSVTVPLFMVIITVRGFSGVNKVVVKHELKLNPSPVNTNNFLNP